MPSLRDRGYAVAKPLGLILLSWPLWLFGSFNLVPTTTVTLWGALAVMAVASGWIAYVRREEMLALLRREGHAILIAEGVFLLMFLAWVAYRAYDPSIDSTEQPMDFAFLNASVLAGYFPPADPWLRGGDVPYYYFGYLLMGNLTEMTLIPTRVSYNLALGPDPGDGGVRGVRAGLQPDSHPGREREEGGGIRARRSRSAAGGEQPGRPAGVPENPRVWLCRLLELDRNQGSGPRRGAFVAPHGPPVVVAEHARH